MNRLSISAVAIAAAALGACGADSTGQYDPLTEFRLTVVLEFQGDATGMVDLGSDGDCRPEDSTCVFAIPAISSASLNAMPGTGSVFVGWSGDCVGSDEEVSVMGIAGRDVSCTATFAVEGTAGPSREGILVANRQTCTPVNGPPASFGCDVAPGGSFNVNAPSPALDAALQTANAYCYSYVDVNEFTSEDHGVVTMTTSLINATATWSGGYYSFTGLTGAPFAEGADAVAVTTSGGTVDVPAPPLVTLVDDPSAGLILDTDGTADSIRLLAFGYTAANTSFGVLCRFPFTDDAPISNPLFLSALAAVSGGAVPYFVLAGVANGAPITGWDDEDRIAEAVRWFQLDGPHLVTMGELQ